MWPRRGRQALEKRKSVFRRNGDVMVQLLCYSAAEDKTNYHVKKDEKELMNPRRERIQMRIKLLSINVRKRTT